MSLLKKILHGLWVTLLSVVIIGGLLWLAVLTSTPPKNPTPTPIPQGMTVIQYIPSKDADLLVLSGEGKILVIDLQGNPRKVIPLTTVPKK